MANSETSETQQPVDQQVTSKTPAAKQKNPKCVAAGKAIAQKTKQAHEAQKKALAEAQIIIANNQIKQAEPPPVADTPVEPPPVADTPVEPTKNVLTTTQWLSVISIIISLAGLYNKRKEIKTVFAKKPPVEMPRVQPPSPVLPRAPQPSPATPKVGIRDMD